MLSVQQVSDNIQIQQISLPAHASSGSHLLYVKFEVLHMTYQKYTSNYVALTNCVIIIIVILRKTIVFLSIYSVVATTPRAFTSSLLSNLHKRPCSFQPVLQMRKERLRVAKQHSQAHYHQKVVKL